MESPQTWDDLRNFSNGHILNERKLTMEQAQEIRDIYATGLVTQYDLAAEYGVAQATISSIVNRKTYIHQLQGNRTYSTTFKPSTPVFRYISPDSHGGAPVRDDFCTTCQSMTTDGLCHVAD